MVSYLFDKSGRYRNAIIMWDKEDYLRECDNHLENLDLHKSIEGDPVATAKKKVCNTLRNILRKVSQL